ncbi:MAG: hypothetical protein IKY68_00520 [Alistipes sp.]|nr:hypothetical protein [Alistipes sp.]
MRRLLTLLFLAAATTLQAQEFDYAQSHSKPLGQVLNELSVRFKTRLKIEVDTAGCVLPYADSRIRPYSIEESLDNVLKPFNYKHVKQHDTYYKIKPYEPHRRLPEEGAKMIAWLTEQCSDQAAFEARRTEVLTALRELLGGQVATLRSYTVANTTPTLTKPRRYAGYTVQNFRIETLPGLYLCGSIYAPEKPTKRTKLPLILSPDGHTPRYAAETQLRMATWARMGAVAVSYDLVGYGESALQLGEAVHHSLLAHLMQLMNGEILLDYFLSRSDIDPTRIGICGASGGGTQTMQLAALDERFTASCPVISLSSYFDGGCPCESAVQAAWVAGGTCNAELAALTAPKPLGVVSDGKDWTAHVPTVELPYLQHIYELYGVADRVKNYHFPKEGHDFGVNKRQAVYDFFAEVFGLDRSKIDEEQVTLEGAELLLFGVLGELLPEGAVRSVNELPSWAAERAKSLK